MNKVTTSGGVAAVSKPVLILYFCDITGDSCTCVTTACFQPSNLCCPYPGLYCTGCVCVLEVVHC